MLHLYPDERGEDAARWANTTTQAEYNVVVLFKAITREEKRRARAKWERTLAASPAKVTASQILTTSVVINVILSVSPLCQRIQEEILPHL